MTASETILVTGASGKLAQLTLAALLKGGQNNLIATTRDPSKLDGLSTKGVDVRRADFKNPAGLAEAFEGATRVLLISTPDTGERVEHHKNAVTAAKAAGVKHIMYTSLVNLEESIAVVAPDHTATEKDIKESGLKYTFLRNNTYAENLLFSLPGALETGTLHGCAGNGKVSYVTRLDCANAAAGALINASDCENTVWDITGSQAYSYAELAALVSEIKNKKVVYRDLSTEEYKAVLIKSGLPEKYASLFASFDLSTKNGDVAMVSGAVRKLTGKQPMGLPEFLKTNLK
jgi:NAD(P)H dehydrogenase (quinone)